MVLLLTESGSGGISTLEVDTPQDQAASGIQKEFCHWKDCPITHEPVLNILEHIQVINSLTFIFKN